MASRVAGEDLGVRLQRLWKGTLYVGVAAGYALLVALLFVQHGWRPALLALFFIGVSQFLRYIASDVDRIGWNLANESGLAEGAAGASDTARYQSRLLVLLVGLVQLLNLALTVQAFVLAGSGRAAATFIGLAFVEAVYWQIRNVNRRVAFEQASYGLRDRGLLRDGPEAVRPAAQVRASRLEKRLDRLKTMAEEGRISEKAYRKARDRYRVQSVMDAEEDSTDEAS